MMNINLTDREKEVLTGISLGYTSKEIAQNLYISDHTVVSYRKTLLSKLGALNAPSMVRKGFEMGFLQQGMTQSMLS